MNGRQCTGSSSSLQISPSPLPSYKEHYSATPAVLHDDPDSPSFSASPPLTHAHKPTNYEPIYPDLDTSYVNTDYVKGEDESDYCPLYNATTESLEKGRWRWPGRDIFLRAWRKFKMPKSLWRKKESKDDGKKIKLQTSLTKRQLLLLMVLCLGTLTSSFAICLFPPYFPRIAQEKGCSSTIFGLIIGTNCLTAFLVTPIIGKKIKTIGVRFALTAGLFCSGGCCVLSGFLEFFPPGPVFVITAILIRMTQATANAGISTASFAYIGVEFPNSMAKVFAWTRMTMNVAQMFGPILGGALLEVGGFKLPFIVMGGIQMSMTIFSCCFLPEFLSDTESGECEEVKIWKIFTIRGIWVSFITFIFSTMSNGFLSITLEPQVLRKYGLGPIYVGILFGLKDGANSLASPFWGWVCDRNRQVKIYILLSSCLAFASFFLLGPFPGVPINRTLGVVVLALILNGIGIGGQQVAGVVDAIRETVDAGFPDGAGTHGCVAGLWASLSGAGRFTSRTGSGFLVDTIGFRKTSVIVVVLHGFVVVMTAVYLMIFRDGAYTRHHNELDDNDKDKQICSGEAGTGSILTTTPSEPFTTKAVNINIPCYRDDLEESIFFGSAPIKTKQYDHASMMLSQSLESI